MTPNTAIHEQIRPIAHDHDELEHGDDVISERGNERAGLPSDAETFTIGDEAVPRDWRDVFDRFGVAGLTDMGFAADVVGKLSALRDATFGISTTDTVPRSLSDGTAAIRMLRDQVHALTQERDDLKLDVRNAVNDADRWRETARVALNEARAARDNLCKLSTNIVLLVAGVGGEA